MPTPDRRYHLQRSLGRGGFGEVYLAVMEAGGVRTEVAVKLLADGLDPGTQALERLRDEGRILGLLNHPVILKVHDLLVLDGRVALVTEYVDGADLQECFATDGVPARALVEVIGRVADALEVAWSAPSPSGGRLELVHRDVKPANVRIGRHGDVKLLDFGIARVADVAREARTKTEALIGTLSYMAPERFDPRTPGGPASDVFALGAVLYEGLLGERLVAPLSSREMWLVAQDEDEHAAFVAGRLDALARRVGGVDATGGAATGGAGGAGRADGNGAGDAAAGPGGPAGADGADGAGEGHRAALLALLAETLASDPLVRPTAAEVARRCERLAEEMPGASLRRYTRERIWPDGPSAEGPLAGRTLSSTESERTEWSAVDPPALARTEISEGAERAAISRAATSRGAASSRAATSRGAAASGAAASGGAASGGAASGGAESPRSEGAEPSGGAASRAEATGADSVEVGSGRPATRWPWLAAGVVGLGAALAAAGAVVVGLALIVGLGAPGSAGPVVPPLERPGAGPGSVDPASRDAAHPTDPSDPDRAAPPDLRAGSDPAAGSDVAAGSDPAAGPADLRGDPAGPDRVDPERSGRTDPGRPEGAGPSGSADPPDPVSTRPAPDRSRSEPTQATFSVAGDVPVELRRGGRVFRPGPVPAERLEIWADFGAGHERVGETTVRPGLSFTIRCSKLRHNCVGAP